ncbi:hypothetical protein GSY74_03640 [Sulfurovum sp. bin170]|uniref:hypothetical protein n=1 Tax=Sulfurovum sp. bin170 TaxID=2695268 RepID=UPI0013DF0504|nr:hypothetical protein [Sulfurovum sp. bin170]NEW60364.1 hypothetical protein [Sulfurovum sp. bin170]
MGVSREERVIDDGNFKKKLLKKIETIEEKYIGGVVTGQSAKAAVVLVSFHY